MTNKKNILIAALAIVIYLLAQRGEKLPEILPSSGGSGNALVTAFANEQSDLQIRGQGVVKKVLPDDTKGLKHQKFILQVNPDQTVLVAHNIDLADRLPGLRKGDTVGFYGEYEWTARGGVMHWTHHDPSGRHIDGWLKYNGKKYQ
jgi:hypothetical protein